jgi:hypothetical protein
MTNKEKILFVVWNREKPNCILFYLLFTACCGFCPSFSSLSPACSVNALLLCLPPSHSPAHAACYFFLSTPPQARPRTLSLLHFSASHFSRPFNPFMRGSAVSKEAESTEKHGGWDPMPEFTITSPYVDSSVDSNTFTTGNPMPESTLTLCQSRFYSYIVRDLGFGLSTYPTSACPSVYIWYCQPVCPISCLWDSSSILVSSQKGLPLLLLPVGQTEPPCYLSVRADPPAVARSDDRIFILPCYLPGGSVPPPGVACKAGLFFSLLPVRWFCPSPLV